MQFDLQNQTIWSSLKKFKMGETMKTFLSGMGRTTLQFFKSVKINKPIKSFLQL